MDSEYSDSARTASEEPVVSGARSTAVISSEFTFLGRPKLDWLATGAADSPASLLRRPSATGHGHHHR